MTTQSNVLLPSIIHPLPLSHWTFSTAKKTSACILKNYFINLYIFQYCLSWRQCILNDILHPSFSSEFRRSTNCLKFAALTFPRRPVKTFWKDFHAVFLLSLRTHSMSLKSCLMCGPMKTPALEISHAGTWMQDHPYPKPLRSSSLAQVLCVVGETLLSLVLAEIQMLHSLLLVLMIFVSANFSSRTGYLWHSFPTQRKQQYLV